MSEAQLQPVPQEGEQEEGTLATMSKEERTKIVSKWVTKFNESERFSDPIRKKNLRLHKLYRAYRDAPENGKAYPYHTNIMPPIAFGVVETIKPRLSAGKMRLRVLPANRESAGKTEELAQWESLANNQITGNIQFQEEKIDWIHAMLNYGNGYLMIHWDDENKRPFYTSLDNWLLYIDKNAGANLKGSSYEIRQIFRDLSILKKRNKETKLYDHLEGLTGSMQKDPRHDRERIETLKMGQIKGNGETASKEQEKNQKGNQVELLEIYDHIEGKLLTIANREELVRYIDNPYAKVNGGRIIVDLPCIKIPWTQTAMSIIEPVESNINEIADTRNHAMESIEYNMDPVKKIRKSSGLTADDCETRPGATWIMAQADDVVVEKGTPINEDWIKKNDMLVGEIQSTLALSEYTNGNPHSSQEPADKVNALLKQSGIRFSQMVRQYEKSLTEVATIVRDLYTEFLPEGLDYRDDYEDSGEFKTFNARDVEVEMKIEVEPDQAKTPAERKDDLLEVYKIFIEDVPAEGADEDDIARFQERKKLLQQMVLEEYGQDQYAEIMATLESRIEDEAEELTEEVDQQEVVEEQIQPQAQPQLPPQQAPVSPVDGPPQGLLQRLLGSLGAR